MAKEKKFVTPEDSEKVTFDIPEESNPLVWMKKTLTTSSGPLGTFNKGGIYQVPFSTYLEFHRLGEAVMVEDQ